MPSTGSTSSCDEADRHGERNRPSANGPSTLFARVRRSAWSELPIASQRAIPPRPTPRCSAVVPGEMPLPNLLQPTCCHVHPQEHPIPRLEGSRPFRPRRRGRVSRAGGNPPVHASVSRGTGWPLLAAPVLGGRAVGAAPTDPSRITPPKGCPVSWTKARPDVVDPWRAG